MVRKGHFIAEYILAFEADNPALPKYRRLYLSLRHAILGGVLKTEESLPSSRMLAKNLGYSRNTVVNAIEQLVAEGYLETRRGSGTFVAANIQTEHSSGIRSKQLSRHLPKYISNQPRTNAQQHAGNFSKRTRQLIALSQRIQPYGGGVLIPGLPDLAAFPFSQWTRINNKHSRQNERKLADFGFGGGYMPLRRAVADYLRRARQVSCEEQQVFITNGTTQSISLLTTLLTNPGDQAWIEEPGYPVAQGMLQAADLDVIPIPVDKQGISIPNNLPAPRLIYTTPSYQFPLGISMPLARRLELLNFCEQQETWILEDDYDGEFRFGTKPIASLQGLNDNTRTIYLGTFSKILTPSLRISYMVVPPQLVDTLAQIYQILGNESSILTQAALEEFITLGYFENHIRRMRKLYGERRQAMEYVLAAHPDVDYSRAHGINGGLHITLGIEGGVAEAGTDEKIVALASQEAMGCRSLSSHCIDNPGQQGLILGYTSCDEKPMLEALNRLLEIIKQSGQHLTDTGAIFRQLSHN